jgi:hypothetical protein
MLEAASRATLLNAVATTVKDHGGSFDLLFETHLYVAFQKL